MANSDKNILITPATNTSGDPRIVYTPNTAANAITQRLTDSGVISFEGSAGQLFSITNSLTGTLFSVNDVSGIPSIDVADTGLVRIAPFNGNLAIGSTAALSTARLSISAAASSIGVIVRANGTTPGNMQEWQNSGGTVLASINSSGDIQTSAAIFAGTSTWFTATANIRPLNATVIGAVIRGQASQTADTLQIQTSAGTVLGGHNAVGQLFTGSTTPILTATGGTIQSIASGANPLVTMASAHGLTTGDLVTLAGTTGNTYNGTFVVASTPASTTFTITSALTAGQAGTGGTVSDPAQASITARSPGTNGLIVRGAASQAVDLIQTQTSGGSVNFGVDSVGSVFTAAIMGTDRQNAIVLGGSRNVALNTGAGSFAGGAGVTFFGNAATAPTSNPTGGGILYVNAGALTYRGTGGSAATIVNADGTIAGGSNSFATISTPSGTSPVADSSTDTLTLTAGTGITITGDSSADSIAISTNATASNTVSTIVLRDGSGNFAAGAITGTSLVSSGSSFDLINTAATTVNFAGAATTLNIGNTATAAQTVNMFTASTGASTYNFATGAVGTTTTKTLNIGTGASTGGTTVINMGGNPGVSTSTINLNAGTINSSAATLALFATPTTITMGAAATTFNIGTGSIAKTINLGTASASATTVNIGTTGTSSSTINLQAPFINLGRNITSTTTVIGVNTFVTGSETGNTGTSGNATAGHLYIRGGGAAHQDEFNTGTVVGGNVYVDAGFSSTLAGTSVKGGVLIGTTTDTGTITIGRTGFTTTTPGAFTATQTITGGNLTSGGTLVRSQLNADGQGTTGCNINTSGQFVRAASSARYKQDIEDANFVYEDILLLSPKTFRLKEEVLDNPDSRFYGGLIAEEVAQIESLKVFVNYQKQEDGSKIPDGIAYAEMVSALVSAIKHQNSIIEDLISRVQNLEN
jgi:hypothetical protein